MCPATTFVMHGHKTGNAHLHRTFSGLLLGTGGKQRTGFVRNVAGTGESRRNSPSWPTSPVVRENAATEKTGVSVLVRGETEKTQATSSSTTPSRADHATGRTS